jgi:hypothetical protein
MLLLLMLHARVTTEDCNTVMDLPRQSLGRTMLLLMLHATEKESCNTIMRDPLDRPPPP